MLKLVFWALVVLDLLGILLLFALGQAAAISSRTSPWLVTLLLLVLPGIALAAAVALFVRSTTPVGRSVALLLAAAPALLLAGARVAAEMAFRGSVNERGEMTFFRAGASRELAEAIMRNDAAAVATLAPTADVNATGTADMTPLLLAVRQLRTAPAEHGALRALLAAGADPNVEAQYELPLAVAIQTSAKAGVEPVRLLLDAGADPNRVTSFGEPAWFTAVGKSASPEALALLLDRGVDVNALGRNGQSALVVAANTRNWGAALMLLERGADPARGRSLNGESFARMVEHVADAERGDSAFAAVRSRVR